MRADTRILIGQFFRRFCRNRAALSWVLGPSSVRGRWPVYL